MAKKPVETATETGTEIATFAPDNPVAILQSAEQFDALLDRIRKEVADFVPDLTTEKGRKAIKSLAYKVTRTKTALDEAGKELNASKRAEIDAVDLVRRKVRSDLDELAETARKPLDDWEKAESERGAKIEQIIASMDTALIWPDECTSDYARSRLDEMNALEFDADIFQEWLEIAIAKKMQTVIQIEAKITALEKSEADAAELEKLRAEKAERDEKDRLAAAQKAEREAERVAEENRKAEASRIEASRIADAEAAEAKRLSDIKEAEDRAAETARADAARVAQSAIDAANAETKRLQDAETARQEQIASDERDRQKREKDRAHMASVMGAAKTAMMEQSNVTEDQARAIVLAIKGGLIPNVSLAF